MKMKRVTLLCASIVRLKAFWASCRAAPVMSQTAPTAVHGAFPIQQQSVASTMLQVARMARTYNAWTIAAPNDPRANQLYLPRLAASKARQRENITCVMESASSRMRSLYGGQGYPGTGWPTDVEAKALILSRTTLMPRSSLAFSSFTLVFPSSGLHGLQSETLFNCKSSCGLLWEA